MNLTRVIAALCRFITAPERRRSVSTSLTRAPCCRHGDHPSIHPSSERERERERRERARERERARARERELGEAWQPDGYRVSAGGFREGEQQLGAEARGVWGACLAPIRRLRLEADRQALRPRRDQRTSAVARRRNARLGPETLRAAAPRS